MQIRCVGGLKYHSLIPDWQRAPVLMGNKDTPQEAKWLEHDIQQSVPSGAD